MLVHQKLMYLNLHLPIQVQRPTISKKSIKYYRTFSDFFKKCAPYYIKGATFQMQNVNILVAVFTAGRCFDIILH